MTDAEHFLALLHTQPLLPADAIVILCGEDGEARLRAGVGLLAQGVAPGLLLSGGRSEPPAVLSANDLLPKALSMGVGLDRIALETESTHTAEQARAVAARAVAESWHRVLLVASGYHLPRAFLTFLKAWPEAGSRLVPFCAYAKWTDRPPGVDRTRAQLARVDWSKIAAYGADVASVEAGIAYLEAAETEVAP